MVIGPLLNSARDPQPVLNLTPGIFAARSGEDRRILTMLIFLH